MLIFGERHLRSVLGEYSAHYDTQRLHRALQLRPPRPESPAPEPIHCRVRRRPVLGGLICECRCGTPGWRTTAAKDRNDQLADVEQTNVVRDEPGEVDDGRSFTWD